MRSPAILSSSSLLRKSVLSVFLLALSLLSCPCAATETRGGDTDDPPRPTGDMDCDGIGDRDDPDNTDGSCDTGMGYEGYYAGGPGTSCNSAPAAPAPWIGGVLLVGLGGALRRRSSRAIG